MRAAKSLLLPMWLSTGAVTAQAQTCLPVGAPMTLLGQAMRETVQLSNGSASSVRMLAMNP
ncbi:hypothetical protein AWB79_05609 [Caballeronia hypogeia]|uniref:Uncharacterized protein n=2 Tax=Caballeronia hypogeia TaxID=1777140 RepID=A0A158CLR1_9BURK|nr:hypothetical protein AWB79_05609 [Caballeronia hypogeia]